MPWQSSAPQLGFSTAEPWLPVGDAHAELAVDRQEGRADSILQFTRECLKLRRDHEAVRTGAMRIVEAGEQLLAFERSAAGERLRCTFNLSDRPAHSAPCGRPLISAGQVDAGDIGPYGALVEVIE